MLATCASRLWVIAALLEGRKRLKAGNIKSHPFTAFVEAIVAGDDMTAIRLLDASPLLTKRARCLWCNSASS